MFVLYSLRTNEMKTCNSITNTLGKSGYIKSGLWDSILLNAINDKCWIFQQFHIKGD